MKIDKISLLRTVLIIFATIFVIYSSVNTSGLPDYALQNSKVREAYQFAKYNPEVLIGINCDCGCSTFHKDLLNCYIRDNGGWEEHASSCGICIQTALKTKQLYGENKTKEEINYIIAEANFAE